MKPFRASNLGRHSAAGPAPGTAEERRLVEAARRGDRRALEQLTRRVSGSLYRFGRGFCRDPHDAEDVMQEALMALVSSLPRFRGESSLSSWAYVVARNACARRRRRGTREAPLDGGEGGAALEIPDPGAAPEHAAERRQLREVLEQAIAALPESLRHVLVLRDVEGLSSSQVGKRLGLGERAVKSRLHRARLRLREMLAPRFAPRAPRPKPDCPDTARMFSRFLEGELDAGTCARLAEHVASCEGCGAACATLRAALGACAAWRTAPMPEPVRGAVRSALRALVSNQRQAPGTPARKRAGRGRRAPSPAG
jgi:RNA polymerase sigma-70 factor (ECF subfamily)